MLKTLRFKIIKTAKTGKQPNKKYICDFPSCATKYAPPVPIIPETTRKTENKLAFLFFAIR